MQLINTFLSNLYNRLTNREEGQTLVEYALIIAGMSITLVVALSLLSGGVKDTFDEIISALGGTGS